MRFHERALARMAGHWRTFPSTGERWAVATHAYAGDLDVFGRASLFQRLDVTSTRYGEEVLARWLSGEDITASSSSASKKENGGSSSGSSGSSAESDFAEALKQRQDAIKDLAKRVSLREELAALGSLLDDEDKKPDPRPFVMWAGQSGSKSSAAALPGFLRVVAFIVPAI